LQNYCREHELDWTELSGISCLSQWLNERSSCVKQLLIAL
jgi:hypothetical protein